MVGSLSSENLPLGVSTPFPSQYAPELLCSIPRVKTRRDLPLSALKQMAGCDRWVCYEVSWLTPTGMPETQVATLTVPADSPAIVESKSLKLYLGSLNFEVFAAPIEVAQRLSRDLAPIIGTSLLVTLLPLPIALPQTANHPEICIDAIAPDCSIYQPAITLLQRQADWVEETLLSYVLRTCCPVTGQPDWATTRIRYRGRAFSHASLVRYLVSFRQHQGFHEACVERIWTDLLMCGDLAELEVLCQFTRRGGVDISPHRWMQGTTPQLLWSRDSRQ